MFVFVIYMKFSQLRARAPFYTFPNAHAFVRFVGAFCVNKISLVSLNHEKVELNESKSKKESEKEIRKKHG